MDRTSFQVEEDDEVGVVVRKSSGLSSITEFNEQATLAGEDRKRGGRGTKGLSRR